MSDLVERARDALIGVTKGPWKLGQRGGYPEVVYTPHGCLWNPSRGEINNRADGEFVAAARTLVPELIARLIEVETDLEWFRASAAASASVSRQLAKGEL